MTSRAAKSNGTDQPAHHKNATEAKAKAAATSYDSHGGICGPFFITLPRPCNFSPLTTGVLYRGIHIFLIISPLNINCWYRLHIGCEGIKSIQACCRDEDWQYYDDTIVFLSHLGKYFIKIGGKSAKIHKLGKIKAIFGLRMTPI